MGFHLCEYITGKQAEEMGLRNIDAFASSGDVTLHFDSGRSWEMPDMARLYIELGWVPQQDFIDDVMNSKLSSGGRTQTRGTADAAPTKIGYLSPKEHPLPLKMSSELPEGFLEKMEGLMRQAELMGNRGQTKGLDGVGTRPGYR